MLTALSSHTKHHNILMLFPKILQIAIGRALHRITAAVAMSMLGSAFTTILIPHGQLESNSLVKWILPFIPYMSSYKNIWQYILFQHTFGCNWSLITCSMQYPEMHAGLCWYTIPLSVPIVLYLIYFTRSPIHVGIKMQLQNLTTFNKRRVLLKDVSKALSWQV